jgi:xanthine dehydrogenase FAD-binding subunit
VSDVVMYSPDTIDELTAALSKMTEKSKIIAGGTDLTIAMHEGRISPDVIIDVSRAAELCKIEEYAAENKISIGAAVTFSEIEKDPTINKYFPAISMAAAGVGSKQIRNRGTIGGNLANGSPAGDMLPPLTALGAEVVTINSEGKIQRKTVGDIIDRNGSNRLACDEAIIRFEISKPRAGSVNLFVKIGSRKAVSVARLSTAIYTGYKDGVFDGPIIILGALGRMPVRAERAAAVLNGRQITDELSSAFAEAMAAEVDAAIPGRYSQPYKREAIKGLAHDLLSLLKDGAAQRA